MRQVSLEITYLKVDASREICAHNFGAPIQYLPGENHTFSYLFTMRVKSSPLRALPYSANNDPFVNSTTGLSLLNVCEAAELFSMRLFSPKSQVEAERPKRGNKRIRAPSYVDSEEELYSDSSDEGVHPGKTYRLDVLSATTRKAFSGDFELDYTPSSNPMDEDVELSDMFIAKAIEVSGKSSKRVPSQKLIQKLGMHTTKQQKAREFLRSIGAITVNFRTELSPDFENLGELQQYLRLQYGSLLPHEA